MPGCVGVTGDGVNALLAAESYVKTETGLLSRVAAATETEKGCRRSA